MKKYLQSGIILLLMMWLVGALIYLSSTEDKLHAAAKLKLEDTKNDGVFARVQVQFKGQEASLSGPVATPEEKAQAEALIKTKIRLPGWFTANINPVTAVHNQITIDPEHAPYRPRPWLIVSLFGGNQRVDGVLKSPEQRQELLVAIAAKLPAPTTPLNNQISIAEKALPCADWDATHTGIPDLSATPQGQSTIAVSPCDGQWSTFPATVSDLEIAAALKSSKVPIMEITHALAKLRSWKNPTPEELKQQADRKAADAAAADAAAAKAAAAKAETETDAAKAKAKADAAAEAAGSAPAAPPTSGSGPVVPDKTP
ncbi:MAG: BON domain-containing protein [Verrucomicrobia bacterium]|nr:BON domain-containing protein [Verrucomicrobiota bacterium]